MFNGKRTNIHNKESVGWPSVVNDGLKATIETKMHEDRHFTIYRMNSFLLNFMNDPHKKHKIVAPELMILNIIKTIGPIGNS